MCATTFIFPCITFSCALSLPAKLRTERIGWLVHLHASKTDPGERVSTPAFHSVSSWLSSRPSMLGQLSRVLSRRTFAPLRRLGSRTGLTSPVGVAAEFGSAPTSASSAGADGTHQAGAELAAAHVPTSACEKVRLAVEAAFTAFLDPERDDAIATLGEVTGEQGLKAMRCTLGCRTRTFTQLVAPRTTCTATHV